ncbi:hypothetical protein RHGRI_010586 [Rhododendron griersonianum]|uniref:Uncharacterized protein n=1 Tax=Rhododendron griersonianum TaxID=479676 RepID=A0AAV6KK72_9ERIC|nr:hypothetical protein RHGRI_010586 [Rhododendron griersonianum]
MAAQRMSLREAIEGSNSSQLPAVDNHCHSVSIEIKEGGESSCCSHSSNNWLNSIMEEGNKYLRSSLQKPKIQTVQPYLREVETNKKSYDPKVVSIGPCHHGKPELQPIERLKIPMVRLFVKKREVKIDELYEEVVKVASDARKCYAEGLTEKFNDEEFTHMMFLDAQKGRAPDEKDKDDDEPVHLLELVRRQDPKAFGNGCVISSSWFTRRSAKDFKTIGIQCKPSRTCQFTDIEFKSKFSYGILTLPKMIIDDTTKSMLLNLVAYESCPDNANDMGVTSYICFMDWIIDQDEDVKELRSKGIVMNYLGVTSKWRIFSMI